MKLISKLLIAGLVVAALPYYASPQKQAKTRKTQLHAMTDWRIQPSFRLDTVCLLNVLTGDPFYVGYYKDEYARFEPQLTPAARAALANLKRRIKDEKKNIISAFLALYFSATDDRTLDDMLDTIKNSERMRKNLKKTIYYNDSGWQLYESVREDLRTVFLFLKAIQFESYWRQNILPKIETKIAEIRKDLPKYNVINESRKTAGLSAALERIDGVHPQLLATAWHPRHRNAIPDRCRVPIQNCVAKRRP